MKLYIETFRESFIISHGKGSLDSLFYSVCYAVLFEKLQKIDKCLDDRFRGSLSKYLFGQLDATKIDFVLDLDYHNFEKQCFLINKLFMNYPKPPKTIQKQPKFIAINHKLLDISYNQPQISRDPQKPVTKCIWLIFSSKILKLYSTIFPKSLKNNEYSDFQFY